MDVSIGPRHFPLHRFEARAEAELARRAKREAWDEALCVQCFAFIGEGRDDVEHRAHVPVEDIDV